MTSFRSDAVGSLGAGGGSGGASGGAVGSILSICNAAAGFASDGGPCLCCGCSPEGSAYRFDRGFMWAANQSPMQSSPSDFMLDFASTFEEVRGSVEVFEQDDNGAGSGDKWRVDAVLEDIDFTGAISLNGTVISDLIDRSYDEHCGFGTGLRDVDGQALWGDDVPLPTVLDHTPVDRGISDSIWQSKVLALAGSSLPGANDPGVGFVRFDNQTSSGTPIELPIRRVHYRVEQRIIVDSHGHNEQREGMIDRLRGQDSYESGPDHYRPCAIAECKLVIDSIEYDVDAYTNAQRDFHLAHEGLVGTSFAQTDQRSPYHPVGQRDYHDYIPDPENDGSERPGMVLCTMTHRAYLISGSTRSLVSIGEYADGAFTGTPGYPDDDSASITFTNMSGVSFVRNAVFNAQALSTDLVKDAGLWVREIRYEKDIDLGGDGEPSQIETVERRERVSVRALELRLRMSMRNGAAENERSSMLSYNNGWVPGFDEANNPEPNDLVVSIYRRCGSVCRDDVFAPFTDPTNPLRELLITQPGVGQSPQVYHWVGQTIIETPNDYYIDDPEYTGEGWCARLGIAVPCEPVAGAGAVLFVKDDSFIAGGTTQITFEDDIQIRYRHVDGSVHSQIEAPPLAWDDVPCFNDGTDRRIATTCVPVDLLGGLLGDVPASATYDRSQMPVGSVTYVVERETTNDQGEPVTVDVPYQITSLPSQNPIDVGVFTADGCPVLNRIVRKCGDSDTIAVIDPQLLTPDAVTVLIDDERYFLTLEVSLDEAVGFEPSPEQCAGGWFEAVRCPGFGNAGIGSAKYQVRSGMVAGEGVVLYRESSPGPNGGVCLTFTLMQPTTNEVDPPDGSAGTIHLPGQCDGSSVRTGDCFRRVDPPIRPGELGLRGQEGSDDGQDGRPSNPMDDVYAQQYARQLGCVGCGG